MTLPEEIFEDEQIMYRNEATSWGPRAHVGERPFHGVG